MRMMTVCKKNKVVQKLSMYVLLKQVTHVLRGAMKSTNLFPAAGIWSKAKPDSAALFGSQKHKH